MPRRAFVTLDSEKQITHENEMFGFVNLVSSVDFNRFISQFGRTRCVDVGSIEYFESFCI